MSAGDHPVAMELARQLASLEDLNARLSAELERLGRGIERVAAKHGADCPEVAAALHGLLRGRADDSTSRAVAALDAIDGDDPDGAHSEADQVLLDAVPAEVADAYERLVARCRWWACA
ncbi:hypothetical protein CFH99_07950 [Nocardioides aromaticivorans]|uniref:Uncharacterized protein n=1 Tax=Nocardioides aromaticivorans TaxID=200618 RepID=A0ABX7PI70_9ACTN|nr:hypothetical protein [Nocardioides aromaticivorans]QSR25554.1 hypothetical protein CFH99_07950 [Nocardioides aromaticivorans]